MRRPIAARLRECDGQLNDIETRINADTFNDINIYLTNYAIIKACGTIEVTFKSIIADYFNKSKIQQVHTFLDNKVRSDSMNPNYTNIIKLLKAFDDNWASDFKSRINAHQDKEQLLDSLKSLNNSRNRFAHGNSPTLSIQQVKQYY